MRIATPNRIHTPASAAGRIIQFHQRHPQRLVARQRGAPPAG